MKRGYWKTIAATMPSDGLSASTQGDAVALRNAVMRIFGRAFCARVGCLWRVWV